MKQKRRRNCASILLVLSVILVMVVNGRASVREVETPVEEGPAYVLYTQKEYVGSLDKWDISPEDKNLVTAAVTTSAGGETMFIKQAIAQCIRTCVEETGLTVRQVIFQCGFPCDEGRPLDNEAYTAVCRVTDGYPAVDTTICYCYNPSIMNGEWHETQTYVCTLGNIRFFTHN